MLRGAIISSLAYILLIGFFTNYLNAQEYKPEIEREVGIWLVSEFQSKISSKWKVKWQHQLRFELEGLDRTVHQLSLDYRINKKIDLSAGARLITDWDEHPADLSKSYWRWHTDASYSLNWKNWKLKNRLRFQMRKRWEDTFDTYPATTDWRLKSQLSYNIKDWKFDPMIGGEIFWHNEYRELDGLTHYRWFIGTAYKWKKKHRIKIQLMQETETKIWEPEQQNVLRLVYQLKL